MPAFRDFENVPYCRLVFFFKISLVTISRFCFTDEIKTWYNTKAVLIASNFSCRGHASLLTNVFFKPLLLYLCFCFVIFVCFFCLSYVTYSRRQCHKVKRPERYKLSFTKACRAKISQAAFENGKSFTYYISRCRDNCSDVSKYSSPCHTLFNQYSTS